MSAVVEQPEARSTEPPVYRSSFGSLLRSEVHRFRSRRFIQVVLAVAVLLWIVATVIALTQFGNPSDAAIAQAEQQISADLKMQHEGWQQCLDDPGPGVPEGVAPEDLCGPEPTRDTMRLVWYLDKAPFDFGSTGTDGALAFAAISAVIAALVGATWIGAEWSSRSLVALLFWVPRRMQVMTAKLLVLVGAAALIGLVAQAAWLGLSGILRAAVGSDAPLPDGFWGDLLQTQGRGVLLTVFAALLAFGLTNLVRNTGAALGIAFVYVVIVENVVRAMRPHWQPWLLSDNALGLVQHKGNLLYFYDGIPDSTGFVEPTEYYLGHLQSGVFLAAVTIVVVGIGALLFAKRDLH
jgi:ABC-type transport system involved in multi-copper enzyme maturation permease subunit